MTQDNRDKFSYIAGHYGQIIKFYNVEEICADEMRQFSKFFANYKYIVRYSIGSIYRILSAQILSENIEKVIYLDSDILVNLDVKEMWQIPLEDKPLAAIAPIENDSDVKELLLCKQSLVDPNDYFNAGVLILNLKRIRRDGREKLWAGIKWLVDNPECLHFDNDIINYAFANDYVKIHRKFNAIVIKRRERGEFQTADCILHYAAKVLSMDFSDPYNKIWFDYFVKTPWFNENIFVHLKENFNQTANQITSNMKNFAVQLTALMAGKKRAFFMATPNIDALKKFFWIQDNEEIIPLENQESFQRLVNSMKESSGKKVFFILFFEGYPQLRALLINAGFVEGRDFINAMMFLSDANGILLNTYPLIRNI